MGAFSLVCNRSFLKVYLDDEMLEQWLEHNRTSHLQLELKLYFRSHTSVTVPRSY